MTLLIATIDTVYDTVINFSLKLCTRVFAVRKGPQLTKSVEHEAFVTKSSVFVSVPEEEKQTFRTVSEVLRHEVYSIPDTARNTVMYASSGSVPVYKNPTIEFDTQIATIPYGELVMMLEPRGRFFRIAWGQIEGWVLKNDLADRAIRVYPEFIICGENTVDQTNTTHVRAILNDPFGLMHSEFPLQAGEYVLYRLWRKGVHIPWPDIRPRTPGLWHKILKGTPRVHVGVTPKVGSIMEYLFENEMGHLAYVEAVFPDSTITISEANYPDSGIYNERELTRDEWKELKPVFISVQ